MPAPRPIYAVSSDAIALTAATAKTIFELRTPASTGIVPVYWWVEFDGVTATAVPVKVEVGIFSAAITTGTATTPLLLNYGNRGLASQCTCNINTSSEGAGTPTITEIHRVSPLAGLLVQEPLGMEMTVGASSFFRIRCTAPAAVNATFGCRWTE